MKLNILLKTIFRKNDTPVIFVYFFNYTCKKLVNEHLI